MTLHLYWLMMLFTTGFIGVDKIEKKPVQSILSIVLWPIYLGFLTREYIKDKF